MMNSILLAVALSGLVGGPGQVPGAVSAVCDANGRVTVECAGLAGTYGEANVKDGTARVLFIQFCGDWQAIDDLRAKWKSI